MGLSIFFTGFIWVENLTRVSISRGVYSGTSGLDTVLEGLRRGCPRFGERFIKTVQFVEGFLDWTLNLGSRQQ